MKDFNFFSISIKEANKKRQRANLAVLSVVLFILIIGSLYLLVSKQVEDKQNDIDKLKAAIYSSEHANKLNILRQKRVELNSLTLYHDAVYAARLDLQAADIIKVELIELIDSVVPETVSFNSVMFTAGIYSVTGTADSRVTIARLFSNFRDLELFSDIRINNISSVDEIIDEETTVTRYSFSLQCSMKGGITK